MKIMSLIADSVFMSAVSDEAGVEKEVVKSATSQDEIAGLGMTSQPRLNVIQ